MDPNPINSIPPSVLAVLATEDQSAKTIGLVATFTSLAFVVVCLRFYARVRFAIQVGWEDWFIAVSMLFSILNAVCQILEVKQGFGKHQVFVDLPSTMNGLRYLYFSILCYCVSFAFIKISILTQYRRIFSVDTTSRVINIVMAIVVSSGIAALFTFMLACVPIDAFWNIHKRPAAKCINADIANYANGTLNTVTDLMIAALPVRALWRLQLIRRQKIVLVFILSVGWFVCIVSILRIISLHDLSRHPQDMTYWAAPPIYWAAIEMNLGLVCACAPSLKPLVVKMVPAFSSHNLNSGSAEQSATHRSRLSTVGRSFHKLSGKDSHATRSRVTDTELGTELSAVNSPTFSQEKNDARNIVITHDVDQRSDRRISGDSDGSSASLVLPGQLRSTVI